MLKRCFVFQILFLFLIFNQCHALLGLQHLPFIGYDTRLIGGINGGYDFKCKNVETSRGYYLGANFEKSLFNILRLQGEFNWQHNPVKSLHQKASVSEQARGHVNVYSLFLNALIDFDCGIPVHPYLGIGVGQAWIQGKWSSKRTQTNDNVFLDQKRLKHHYYHSLTAFQGIAGLRYEFCFLSVDLEYRYFNAEGKVANHKMGIGLSTIF